MKTLTEYNIYEGLSNDVKKFFDNVFKTQEKLIEKNKVQPIDVDVTKLNKPKHSFKKEDLSDNSIKQIIASKHTGFTVAMQMLSNENKYFKDEDKEYNPECYPYFYKDGKNIYCVGLLMYDEKINYIDQFVTLLLIESSMIVSKSINVDKGILNDFINMIKGKYKGICVKPVHPKLKATFTKLGFTSMKDNKDILTYKL
jgi:hypothetical protein